MRAHSDEVRAQVLAALMQGMAVRQVARQFQVSPTTVRNWRQAAGISDLSPISPEKKRDLGELLANYLHTGLEALEAQARVAADPEWIKKQPADQLAILHGVIADKLVRVLASLEPAEPDD